MAEQVVYWGLPVAAILVVAGVIALVRHLNEPTTLQERVAALVGDPSCLGGGATRERVRAAERPDLYPDLLPQARSVVIVACDYGGPVSIVVEFHSAAALQRAFAHSRTARRSRWCVVGEGAFDGNTLDHRGDLARFCSRVHGTVRT